MILCRAIGSQHHVVDMRNCLIDITSIHNSGSPIETLCIRPTYDSKISILYSIESKSVIIAINQEKAIYRRHLVSDHCLMAMNIGAIEKEIAEIVAKTLCVVPVHVISMHPVSQGKTPVSIKDSPDIIIKAGPTLEALFLSIPRSMPMANAIMNSPRRGNPSVLITSL